MKKSTKKPVKVSSILSRAQALPPRLKSVTGADLDCLVLTRLNPTPLLMMRFLRAEQQPRESTENASSFLSIQLFYASVSLCYISTQSLKQSEITKVLWLRTASCQRFEHCSVPSICHSCQQWFRHWSGSAPYVLGACGSQTHPPESIRLFPDKLCSIMSKR